jgi:hypothetical protein
MSTYSTASGLSRTTEAAEGRYKAKVSRASQSAGSDSAARRAGRRARPAPATRRIVRLVASTPGRLAGAPGSPLDTVTLRSSVSRPR